MSAKKQMISQIFILYRFPIEGVGMAHLDWSMLMYLAFILKPSYMTKKGKEKMQR